MNAVTFVETNPQILTRMTRHHPTVTPDKPSHDARLRWIHGPAMRWLRLTILSLFLLGLQARDVSAQWTPVELMGALDASYLTDCGGVVFFAGRTSANGMEPWVTYGTPATTYLLRDINPGSSGSDPRNFVRIGNVVYFSAFDNTNGRELWKTNLSTTPPTTSLVKNIRPGPSGSNPRSMTSLNGKLVFSANDNPATTGDELWVSDGTEAGTYLLKDIYTGDGNNSGINANTSFERYRPLFTSNGIAYFDAYNGSGTYLWRTDGTAAGTFKLADLGSPSSFVTYNSQVYFFASNSDGSALCKSNGQAAGTVVVKGGVRKSSSNEVAIVVAGGLMFFAGHNGTYDSELWRSDGTAAGTYEVKNIRGNNSSEPYALAAYNNTLYFVANDGQRGNQIWKSNGSEAGTVIVHEMYNGASSLEPNPDDLVVFGGYLFFNVRRDGYGREWWTTDGTHLSDGPAFETVSGSGSAFSDDYALSGSGFYFASSNYRGGIYRLGVPLTLSAQPQPKLAALGSAVSFTATPAGGASAETTWKKNGAMISGATSGTYSIPSVALGDAGNYQAVLIGADGAATSNTANLGVVDTALPAQTGVPEKGKLTLTVKTAAPPGTALSYVWKRGATVIHNVAGRISGATTDKFTISNVSAEDAGSYTCTVGMDALSLTTSAVNVQVITPPVVTTASAPPAIVSGSFNWQLAADGLPTSYIVSGLPSGLKYDAKTGLITGTPNVSGSFKIKVSARNAAGKSSVQEFTLVINALPAGTGGLYTGMIGRNATLNGNLGGSISPNIGKAGLVTGVLRLGAASHPLKGRLNAPVGGNPAASITVKRKGGLPDLTVSFTVTAASNSLTNGIISDGTNQAAFTCWRRKWGAGMTQADKEDLDRYLGLHSFALKAPGGQPALPQGSGFGSFATAKKSGTINIKGKLADGTAFTCSTFAGPAGQVLAFKTLYKNKGSVLGTLNIAPGTAGFTPPYGNNVMSGTLSWLRPAIKGRLYAAGFGPYNLTAVGGRYIPPVAPQLVLGITNLEINNARLAFSGVTIANLSPNLAFRLSAGSKFVPPPVDGNPRKTKLSVNAKTGVFSGGFALSDANAIVGTAVRPATFQGQIVRDTGGVPRGYGFFLLADPPAAAGETVKKTAQKSGLALFEKNP